jgi:hypothetical protein
MACGHHVGGRASRDHSAPPNPRYLVRMLAAATWSQRKRARSRFGTRWASLAAAGPKYACLAGPLGLVCETPLSMRVRHWR